MTDTITREEQMEMTKDLLQAALDMGYSRAEVEVTRGGTVKAKADRDAGPARRHEFKAR